MIALVADFSVNSSNAVRIAERMAGLSGGTTDDVRVDVSTLLDNSPLPDAGTVRLTVATTTPTIASAVSHCCRPPARRLAGEVGAVADWAAAGGLGGEGGNGGDKGGGPSGGGN